MSDGKKQSSPLLALQAWYTRQCDGEWEHEFGVKIETLDNPGWSVDVDLRGTLLADRVLEPEQVERHADDWVHYEVKGQVFRARGGSMNLEEMLERFLAWSREAE